MGNFNDLADSLNNLSDGVLHLQMISCKGLKIWPKQSNNLNSGEGDHWRTRFTALDLEKIKHSDINYLLSKLTQSNLDFVKIENLYNFD
ncbi:MAG: NADP-dependent isocitrate dehydrogenase, partial [Sphingobacteriaceae bacterium]